MELNNLIAAHKLMRNKLEWSFNQNVYTPGFGIGPKANKADKGYKLLNRAMLHIEQQIRVIRLTKEN